MEPFVEQKKDDQPVLFTIERWMNQYPGMTAGFTSRHGGVSGPPYTSLNCGLHVNDIPEHVVKNRMLLAEAIGQPFESFTYAEQVHGNDVIVVSKQEKGLGRLTREEAIQAKDGFITNEKGIILCAQFADCVPLYFYDPVKQVVGLAHAGWKGTVLKISMATISSMTHTFGSRPEHIRAAIGPSIGACCYEVDDTVAARVREVLSDIGAPANLTQQIIQSKENGKYLLNLQVLNRILIEQAGILSLHIEVTQLCTSCSTNRFFSHRKEGGTTGRMVAWIGIT
ncbi:peptidoglycan editing factor PgeF [Paenibacillus sedimenti]|uniref:Purine nucleoside phosphorylase n=1 Tax=Paenibacillus sedimenti TaxID=2770274 RepID=A0A926KNC6_9BACL|nr:peptidoglycan editing factor PgeF [Paenibacillus sedimenti]MBD0379190.1 peptidoglycan editing factor PgeF [Paenibacillus sedimenti]